MAATVQFIEDYGAAISTSTGGERGTTRASGVGNVNWKNAGDTTTVYSDAPITAGNNSYEKYQAVCFSGAFNQVTNCKLAHVSGVLGAGLLLKAVISGSGVYRAPAATAYASLTLDWTQTGDIATGYSVSVGGRGPEASGKGTSTTMNPAFSQYLVTQLQTTVAAAAGDTETVTFQFRYDENG
jgi:hypothetical protein